MNWFLKSQAPSAFFKQFPEFSPLIVQLFYNRGLKNQSEVDEFFNPDFQSDLFNPFLLKEMKKAIKRIRQAIKEKEKIVIFGDYDADGVCASAVLFLTFQSLGIDNLNVYIPDRDEEGHGLNKQAIEMLVKQGANLIITVDCGSRDLAEVKLAKNLGLDVIITDHHKTSDKLPKAAALINPWQKQDQYPFKELSGTGVAYKLAVALLADLEKENSLEKWLLDLVALATVADVMPIIGENRTLVKYGLGVLAQTRWLGLKTLMETASLNPEIKQASLNGEAPCTNLDTYTLGYILGPRLNAASRVNHADVAFKLLITQDKIEANKLAQQLNQENSLRQNLTDKVVLEIKNRLIEKFSQSSMPKLIFEGSPDWPVGIIGLAAGKIMDKYHRPVIIYQEKKGIIFGSGRSIAQFDLMAVLEKCADYFDDFGGHRLAAGFRMKKGNLPMVEKVFRQMADEKIKEEDLTPLLEIDKELSLEEITWQNYDQIQFFVPFGRANPMPRFLVRGLEVISSRVVGNNGKHLKMELTMFDQQSKTAKKFKAIGFCFGERAEQIKTGEIVDAVFELIADEWNGSRELQMKIVDLKISEK